MNVGKRMLLTMGFALDAAVAQAGDADATLQALNQLNASLNQLNQQIQQQNAGAAEVQQQPAAVQVQTQAPTDNSAQRRASLDARIQYLRTKIEHQRQNLANAESRLDQAARSGGSTITLSRTVNIESTTLRNYENQLAQAVAQRAAL